MLGPFLLAATLAAAPPPPKKDLVEIESLDETTESVAEKDARRFESHVVRLVPASGGIVLAEGDTAFVEVEVPLTVKLDDLRATVDGVKGGRTGVEVLPTPEVVRSSAKSALVRYAVQARTLTEPAKIALRIQLWAGEQRVGELPMMHTVSPGPPRTGAEDLELDKRAYQYFQRQAEELYRQLKSLHDYLRLDRLDRPPAASRVAPEQAETVERFYALRTRAEIAKVRLRAAADGQDAATARLATVLLGTLTKKPSGPAARARAIEGLDTPKALELTAIALEDLRIDEAEGFLVKLRTSGRLQPQELARALELQAAVDAMRGREASAKTAYGQALCVDPSLKPRLQRPFFREGFEAAKAANTCQTPVKVQQVLAKRTSQEGGPKVVVSVLYGPDPHHVVSGGEVQLWGSGGEVHSADRIRAADDGAHIEVTFDDTGDLENYAGQILVKVLLKDLSGVKLATLGDPDPVPVAIASGESTSTVEVPWWIWAVLGGVVVAGAATAGVVVIANSAGGETRRGIGPIDVTF